MWNTFINSVTTIKAKKVLLYLRYLIILFFISLYVYFSLSRVFLKQIARGGIKKASNSVSLSLYLEYVRIFSSLK